MDTIAITYSTGGGMFGGGSANITVDVIMTESRTRMATSTAMEIAYNAIQEYLRTAGRLIPEDPGAGVYETDFFITTVAPISAAMTPAADSVTVSITTTTPGSDFNAESARITTAMEFIEQEIVRREIPGILRFESDLDAHTITRVDRSMTATLDISIADGHTISVVQNAINIMMDDLLENHSGAGQPMNGITQLSGGFDEQLNETMTEMIIALAVGFLLVYLVMVAMFQSFKLPFIVMITVPLAFTGGFVFLWMTGMTMSVVALIGFVILMGVVTNNGIVMIDYINKRRADGATVREAVLDGANVRARPIIMNALTTIIAMTPLAIGIGTSGALMQPMAIANIGGLFYAMFMSLLVIPAFYSIAFFRRDKREQKEINNRKLEDEQDAGTDAPVLQGSEPEPTPVKKQSRRNNLPAVSEPCDIT